MRKKSYKMSALREHKRIKTYFDGKELVCKLLGVLERYSVLRRRPGMEYRIAGLSQRDSDRANAARTKGLIVISRQCS